MSQPNEKVVARPSSAPLTKSFEPQAFESATYRFWSEAGCFDASDTNVPGQQSFCIVIPPQIGRAHV